MTAYFEEFPFDEIRDPAGDYFNTVEDAVALTKCQANQMWSVTISDSDNPMIRDVYTFGPPDFRTLGYRAGYLVTVEKHNGNTLYVENIMVDEFA
jgi:hypothetical protein